MEGEIRLLIVAKRDLIVALGHLINEAHNATTYSLLDHLPNEIDHYMFGA